jgi:hypothetical protein
MARVQWPWIVGLSRVESPVIGQENWASIERDPPRTLALANPNMRCQIELESDDIVRTPVTNENYIGSRFDVGGELAIDLNLGRGRPVGDPQLQRKRRGPLGVDLDANQSQSRVIAL